MRLLKYLPGSRGEREAGAQRTQRLHEGIYEKLKLIQKPMIFNFINQNWIYLFTRGDTISPINFMECNNFSCGKAALSI